MDSHVQTSVEQGSYTYRITLSPKEDTSHDLERKFCKWASKAELAYVVAEHGSSGKRHLHALLCFETRRVKHHLQQYIWQNHVKPYHPTSIQKVAVVINTAFDHKWYDEYLQKEGDKEVLVDKWDPTHAKKYLPTLQEQEDLLTAKEDTKRGRAFHDHKMWTDLSGHFKTWYIRQGYPVPMETFCHAHHCLEFLNYEMVKGHMIVMVDPRRRTEKAIWLWRMATNNWMPTEGEKQILEKHVNGI